MDRKIKVKKQGISFHSILGLPLVVPWNPDLVQIFAQKHNRRLLSIVHDGLYNRGYTTPDSYKQFSLRDEYTERIAKIMNALLPTNTLDYEGLSLMVVSNSAKFLTFLERVFPVIWSLTTLGTSMTFTNEDIAASDRNEKKWGYIRESQLAVWAHPHEKASGYRKEISGLLFDLMTFRHTAQPFRKLPGNVTLGTIQMKVPALDEFETQDISDMLAHSTSTSFAESFIQTTKVCCAKWDKDPGSVIQVNS